MCLTLTASSVRHRSHLQAAFRRACAAVPSLPPSAAPHAGTHAHMHPCIHACTHARTHLHMCVHILAHVRAHTCARAPTECMHALHGRLLGVFSSERCSVSAPYKTGRSAVAELDKLYVWTRMQSAIAAASATSS